MDSLSSVDDLLVAINIFITDYIEGFFCQAIKSVWLRRVSFGDKTFPRLVMQF